MVLALVLAVGATTAFAQCGGGGGCGRMQGGCVMSTPPGSTPLVLLAQTRALYAGEANISLTETLGGIKLMVKVTDRSHQPDPKASATVYGTGHFGSRGFKLTQVSPGVWATMANLANIDELAVRVSKPGVSQVMYVGLPGHRLGGRGCGGGMGPGMKACACGESCKCASGDTSECKCGAACACAARACKATEDGKCSMMVDGKCAQMGDCKAKGGNCPRMGAGCPMQDKCPMHKAQGAGCGGNCKQKQQ